MKNNLISLIAGFLIIGLAVFYTSFDYSEKEEESTEKTSIVEEDSEISNIRQKEDYMNYQITIETNKGDIKFETFANEAPNTVQNFIKLTEKGFYDELIFHRVIKGFMIQGGDPHGTGTGGPGYTFDDEINPELDIYQEGYNKGIVAMANSGPNTNGSQFFIMVEDYPLPPQYTIFGKVVEGQDIADKISKVERDRNDKPVEDIAIEKVSIEEIN